MRYNKGNQNEEDLIKAIGGKEFEEFGNNLKNMLRIMFEDIDDSVFTAEPCDPAGKPDIKVTYHGVSKYVSVKSGGAIQIHAEKIRHFILFLRSKGISKATQRTILLYQYGDGSMDGTGKDRLTYEEIIPKMRDEVNAANLELNKDKDFIAEFVHHIIFEGNSTSLPKADYIYFGTPEYGLLCSANQIDKHVRRKCYTYIKSPHIGPVIFGPRARYVNYNSVSEEQRDWVGFKWCRLEADMSYISDRYDY